MGDLDSPQRERLRRLSSDDTNVARTREPGRSTAISASHSSAGAAVGKRTLAESWSLEQTAAAQGPSPLAFSSSVDSARRHLDALRAANESGDQYASCEAAHQAQIAIDAASHAAADDQQPAVAELAAIAAPLLAAAFVPSRDAIDEAVTGNGGRAHWDRDVTSWRAARQRDWLAHAAPLASQLGIEAVIRVDDRPDAHGARGLAQAGVVHLSPTLAPTDANALHVLAHELVHVAQSRLPVAGSVADAEREADALATALTHGALPHRPHIGLAADVAAADNGAEAVEATEKAVLATKAIAATMGRQLHDVAGAIKAGNAALHTLEQARTTLFPSYRRAVDALDPMPALELAHKLMQAIRVSEDAKKSVGEAVTGLRSAVSSPAQPTSLASDTKAQEIEIETIHARFLVELPAFEIELSMRMGPQQLDGVPVLGRFTLPHLGPDPAAVLIHEAATVVELIGIVRQVRTLVGTTMKKPNPADAEKIAGLIEPWRSRPVNFAFLAAALRREGLWESVSGLMGHNASHSLAETEQINIVQIGETGALADVGTLNTTTIGDLLVEHPQTYDGVGSGANSVGAPEPAVAARQIVDGLWHASAGARGPLLAQLKRMSKLDDVFGHIPFAEIKKLHDVIDPNDPEAASWLEPFFVDKGGGRSMNQIYESQINDDLEAGNDKPWWHLLNPIPDVRIRAFAWTFLKTAHNGLTAGFENEISASQEAHEQGLITDSEFASQATLSVGKAAAITIASTATGGVAGEFGLGAAEGLGASRSIAELVGAGTGGFGAGIGGHLGGDVYDQAVHGKDGFDSFDSYLESGKWGAIEGLGLGTVSVGAGRYLRGPGIQMRPIAELAARFPRSATVLERVRAAGFTTGKAFGAVAVKIRVTVAELRELISSGLGHIVPEPVVSRGGLHAPPPVDQFLALPPGSDVEITVSANSIEGHGGADETIDALRIESVTALTQPEDAVATEDVSKTVHENGLANDDAKSAKTTNKPKIGDEATSRTEAEPKSKYRRLVVTRSQLSIGDSITSKEWTFHINAPLGNGNEHLLAYGGVMLDANGLPEGAPAFVLEKRTVIDSQPTKIDIADPAGTGVLSLSDLALTEALRLFEARFGRVPDVLSGDLAWENRENFQAEYLKAVDRGMTPDDAEVAAAKAISFCTHRAALGYDQVTVKVTSTETIQFGTPPRPRVVPRDINITTRRR